MCMMILCIFSVPLIINMGFLGGGDSLTPVGFAKPTGVKLSPPPKNPIFMINGTENIHNIIMHIHTSITSINTHIYKNIHPHSYT